MMNLQSLRKWSLSAGLTALLIGTTGCSPAATQPTADPADDIYATLPFQMEAVQRPSFPSYTRSITEYDACPDGVTLNTDAINRAISEVSAHGGGTVEIPSGLWLTGPIVLQDNVCLHLDDNALVLFAADHTLYPIIDTSFEGLETRRCQAPISARGAKNIAITGRGVMDGNGDTWRPVKKNKLTDAQWKKLVAAGGIVEKDVWYPSEGSLKGANACKEFNVPEGIQTPDEWNSIRDWLRPVLLSFVGCEKVLLEGVTFKNSPSWCLHPLSCKDITIDGVIVSNPWYSQNGDALDLESCDRALIQNCSFDAGDDGICIKSGKDADGRRRGEPCQNVIIRNNVVLHGHGGFVVGSEMSGGVKNIYVDNCTFLGTDVGLRFKSTRGRGGVVENIHISRINMINIPNEALIFNLFYGGKGPGEDDQSGIVITEIPPVTEETPAFRDIYIRDVTAKNVGRAILFNGLPEMPIQNINLEDVTITDAKDGVILNRTTGAVLKNVQVRTVKGGDNLKLQSVSQVSVNGQSYEKVEEAISVQF